MELDKDLFWKNKKVLITGHTGFKGSWLATWLNLLGSNICGISLMPENDLNLFEQINLNERIQYNHFVDLREIKNLSSIIEEFKPDIVFHLAAQSLVIESFEDPIKTWSTNVMGTANLLSSLSNNKNNCVVIIVTTDKVYKNKEWIYGYREIDRLGGNDPYSASKAATELLVDSWRKSFCKKEQKYRLKIASVRAGNVIGGGDWAKYRLIPDSIKSLSKKEIIKIRNPSSTRPWQHVLEPLSGYLYLAKKISLTNDPGNILEDSFNFGPKEESNKSVLDVINLITKKWEGKYIFEDLIDAPHESKLLSLNINKAKKILDWQPKWDFEKTIDKTLNWYKKVLNENADPYICCLEDINDYLS